ncbi:MAG: FAD-binding protein [Pseudonocardiales bacterium]|nr:FAD-binding protein [Pseudonocardiales bacterium]
MRNGGPRKTIGHTSCDLYGSQRRTGKVVLDGSVATSSGVVLRNWNNSAVSTPRVVVVPKNLQELIDVVKDTKYPSPLRVGGSFHSLNPCFATDGTQILMCHFAQVDIDVVTSTVTVGAAVKMIEIRNRLRPYGMQIAVAPEIGNATAGSVSCCGTKDASLGRFGSGQVSSTVIGVKLVDADGNVETITEADDPEKMRIVRSSYGLLGIIFEVTFRIEKQSILSYDYKIFDLASVPSRDKLFGGADGVLAFCLPYSNRIIAERRRAAGGQACISRFSRFKRLVRDKIWAEKASLLVTLVPYNWFFNIFDRVLVLAFRILSLLGGFAARRADSNINYKFDRIDYFDFTFWAIPVSRWEEFIPKYVTFCRDYFRETGFRASLVSSVYFINKDRKALLSFSPSEDIFTMDLADSRPNDPLWIEFNRRYDAFVSEFGARPLLNQTKQLSADIVYKTLGNDWSEFLSYHKENDPSGRFLSKYFVDLM